MLYFLLPYGNICSLIRLFRKISYIFMIRKIVRKCAITRIRPQASFVGQMMYLCGRSYIGTIKYDVGAISKGGLEEQV